MSREIINNEALYRSINDDSNILVKVNYLLNNYLRLRYLIKKVVLNKKNYGNCKELLE